MKLTDLPVWLKLVNHKPDAEDEPDEDDGDIEMHLHAPIGMGDENAPGVTSDVFGRVLCQIPKERGVTLTINSMGGDVQHGVAIHNMLVARGGVTTRVVGYAASMGAIIAQAGAKRQMMPGTMMVIHNPQGKVSGEEKDMEKMKDVLKKVKASLVDLLSSRTGQDKGIISNMMDETATMDAKTAKRLGFCDEVMEGAPAWNEMNPVEFADALHDIRNYNPNHGEGGRFAPGGESPSGKASRAADVQSNRASDATRSAQGAVLHSAARVLHDKAEQMHSNAASAYPEGSHARGYHEQRAISHKAASQFHASEHAAIIARGNERRPPTNSLGEPAGELNNNNNKSMKLLIAALTGLVKMPDTITDEQAAPQVQASLQTLLSERDTLKAENQTHLTELEAHRVSLKSRVTNRVQAAIDAKVIKPERKDSLIAIGIKNESDLDFLSDVQAAAPAARRGAPAVKVTPGAEDEPTVESIRNDLRDARCATGSEDDDQVKLGIQNARAARKLRDLRGHKDLFAVSARS